MIIQGYPQVKTYRAQGQLLIETERTTAVPGLAGLPPEFYEDPEPYFQTQYKILKGRDLTRRVVKRVKLAQVPEFNGTAKRPSTPLTLISDLRERLSSLIWNKTITQEAPRADETPDESALVGAFVSRVNIDPVRGSRLVLVSFDATDPTVAATATNGLMDEYVEQNLEVKLQASQNMLDWLQKELSNQQ